VSAVEHVRLPAGRWELRPPDPADADDARAMLLDPEVAQWNPGPLDPTVEEARDWLVRSAQWSESYVGWSVHDREDTGRYAGSAFLFHIDQEQRAGSVAYRTAPWARGRGAATSAVVAMTGFAFDVLELERLSLPHAVANAASCRVADKAGFVLEGTEVGGYRDEQGVRWDSHVHGLLRDGIVTRSSA
jgi:RimJ/RimL family protein N-acetyltransferase